MAAPYTADEIGRRGEALYQQQIRAQVENGNTGKYVVIDIETGEYELGDDHYATIKRALAKRPEAILYGIKIGYPATARLGGRMKPIAS